MTKLNKGDEPLKTAEKLDAMLELPHLDAAQAIEAYCMLSEEVHRFLGFYVENDCMCGKGGFNEHGVVEKPTFAEGYRNDGAVLRYIVATMRATIAANPRRPEHVECE